MARRIKIMPPIHPGEEILPKGGSADTASFSSGRSRFSAANASATARHSGVASPLGRSRPPGAWTDMASFTASAGGKAGPTYGLASGWSAGGGK